MRVSERLALCALALVFATGRAGHAAEAEIDAANMQRIKKVGIVSLLPQALEVSYLGNLVLDNFHYYGRVEWWDINAYVESALAAQLKQRERFELKALTYDRGALFRRTTEATFLKPAIDVLQPDLAALAAANGVDALFVVLPGGAKGALCGNTCGTGYGNSGFGVYSVGARIGPQSLKRGDDAYVSMKIAVTLPDGSVLAENQVAASKPVPFNRSNEFTGIPAPMLEQLEKTIKGLVDRQLPIATAQFGLFNTVAPAGGDPKLMPALKIDTVCCPLTTSLAGDITAGYLKAVQTGGLKVGEETALLTVRSLVKPRKSGVLSTPVGENRIDAVLEFRGNQYSISERAGPLSNTNDVANALGALSLDKVRAFLDPAAPRRERAPTIPRGPE